MRKVSALCGIFLPVPVMTVADELALINGDTLTGTIITMSEGKLQFKSSLLGNLEIPMSAIQSFSSDKPLDLRLKSGEVVRPKAANGPAGFIELTGIHEAQPLALSQIEQINPPPQKPVEWNGKIFAGLNVETGNTEAQDIDVNIKATRETDKDRMILGLDYEENRSEEDGSEDLTTTKRYYRLGAHYDYFVSDHYYVYVDGKAERETTADLERRIAAGSGLGYRWVETRDTRLDLEGGLSWVSESFTDGSSDEDYAALRTGWRFLHDFSEDLNFFNDAEWLVSLRDQEDQLFTLDTGLAYQLNSHLSLDARVHYDWDKTPAEGNETEDFRYVFGVSWGF